MVRKLQVINPGYILIITGVLLFIGAGCSRNVKISEDRQIDDAKVQATERTYAEKKQDGKGDNILKAGEGGDDQKTEAAFKLVAGEYRMRVSGFTGTLMIVYEVGVYSGTIRFDGLGNNVPQPLKNLRIKDGKIYFIRSVTTDEEMKKYGSRRYFVQTYHGTFSEDGKQIKGRYMDSGTENRWEASM
jgi:hypothetical protein